MRRVHLYTANHGHAAGIQDTVTMIRNGARDAGYDARVSDRIVSGEVNVLLEHFVRDDEIDYLRSRTTGGTRLIVVCSELVSAQGFNVGLLPGPGHYGDTGYWRRRFDGFAAVASFASELWVLSRQQVPAYEDAFPWLPVHFLPHGWVSGMDRVEHLPESRKDIDFYFSGSLTPARQAVLDALARRHSVCFSPQGAADYLRLDLLARTRVCLSLPLSPANRLPSVSRIHYHLQNRNYVVQQAYAEGCDLDPYVLHAPADDFVEWACAALDLDHRREVAEAAHVRFREERPLARWIGPMLEACPAAGGARIDAAGGERPVAKVA